jgi:hypothetical protein
MKEDQFTIPGLKGHLVLTKFVSSIRVAACLAEVDNRDDILLVRVRGWELVGLGIAGLKNKVAELVSLFIMIGAHTGASVCISSAYEV